MSVDPDRELERRFLEARAADERRVPAFATVLARRPRAARPVHLPLALGLGLAVLVVAAAITVWRAARPNEPRLVIAFTPGEMRMPTDYLLDMASYPRAGDIPRIGASDWFPLPFAGVAGPDTRRSP
jgi:hypothetical protein